MEKFSLTDIKKMNYSDVYHYIYSNDKCSKQSIANALQMSLPTVTQHLNMLLQEGFIETCGQLQSQIGRKAVAYTITPSARVSIGVEILKNKLTIAVLDLYGHIWFQKICRIPFQDSADYFKKVSTEIRQFILEQEIESKNVLGIAFALQGLVSQDSRNIIYGKILDCTGLSISSFEEHLDYPCRFVHDAECAAMTELWDHPKLSHAVYFSLGYHLGGAIIINGEIQSGRTGRSGTIEHMTLVPGGLPCYCGQMGCMECYCSANALLAGNGDSGNEDLDAFFEAKNAGSREQEDRWVRYLNYLAMAINNLHMVIDSEVILGGHLAPYMNEQDLEYLHARMQKTTAFPEADTFLSLGKRKSSTVATGAALYYIKDFLQNLSGGHDW